VCGGRGFKNQEMWDGIVGDREGVVNAQGGEKKTYPGWGKREHRPPAGRASTRTPADGCLFWVKEGEGGFLWQEKTGGALTGNGTLGDRIIIPGTIIRGNKNTNGKK